MESVADIIVEETVVEKSRFGNKKKPKNDRRAQPHQTAPKPLEPTHWAIVTFKASKKDQSPMAHLPSGKILFVDRGCKEKAEVGETWSVTFADREGSNVVFAHLERHFESDEMLNNWLDQWDAQGQNLDNLTATMEISGREVEVSFGQLFPILNALLKMGAVVPAFPPVVAASSIREIAPKVTSESE